MGVLVAGALAAVVLVVGAVTAGAESGPKCADITGETHGGLNFWNSTTGAGSLNVDLATASGDACKQVTYTLVVSGVTGPPVVVSQKGNDVFLSVAYTDTDNQVCISATTASSGGHVHDAAPDASCLVITSGTTGGGGGFN